MAPPTFEFTTEDIDYLRHGDKPLKLRLYKPRGSGPFPAVVDLHGGAWGKGSLEECRGRDEVLARSGLLVAALDFRDGNHGYPTALVDINYAIRWLKARAQQYQTRTDLILYGCCASRRVNARVGHARAIVHSLQLTHRSCRI